MACLGKVAEFSNRTLGVKCEVFMRYVRTNREVFATFFLLRDHTSHIPPVCDDAVKKLLRQLWEYHPLPDMFLACSQTGL